MEGESLTLRNTISNSLACVIEILENLFVRKQPAEGVLDNKRMFLIAGRAVIGIFILFNVSCKTILAAKGTALPLKTISSANVYVPEQLFLRTLLGESTYLQGSGHFHCLCFSSSVVSDYSSFVYCSWES